MDKKKSKSSASKKAAAAAAARGVVGPDYIQVRLMIVFDIGMECSSAELL